MSQICQRILVIRPNGCATSADHFFLDASGSVIRLSYPCKNCVAKVALTSQSAYNVNYESWA